MGRKRRPDGSVGDSVGEGVEAADVTPQPEFGIVVGDECGQVRIQLVRLAPQPDDPELSRALRQYVKNSIWVATRSLKVPSRTSPSSSPLSTLKQVLERPQRG